MTLEDMARGVVFALVIEHTDRIDDIVALGLAKERAILEDGHDMRSKLLQKFVCKFLFDMGYEYSADSHFYMPKVVNG